MTFWCNLAFLKVQVFTFLYYLKPLRFFQDDGMIILCSLDCRQSCLKVKFSHYRQLKMLAFLWPVQNENRFIEH